MPEQLSAWCAEVGGGAADRRRGLEQVGGALGLRAVAALPDVTRPSGGPAHGAPSCQRVGRAGAVHAVAGLSDVTGASGRRQTEPAASTSPDASAHGAESFEH